MLLSLFFEWRERSAQKQRSNIKFSMQLTENNSCFVVVVVGDVFCCFVDFLCCRFSYMAADTRTWTHGLYSKTQQQQQKLPRVWREEERRGERRPQAWSNFTQFAVYFWATTVAAVLLWFAAAAAAAVAAGVVDVVTVVLAAGRDCAQISFSFSVQRASSLRITVSTIDRQESDSDSEWTDRTNRVSKKLSVQCSKQYI